MSNYWKRLQNHPGVPIAALLSIAGPIAGLLREDGDWRVGLIMLIFWVPVLITARTQPLPAPPDREDRA